MKLLEMFEKTVLASTTESVSVQADSSFFSLDKLVCRTINGVRESFSASTGYIIIVNLSNSIEHHFNG